MHSYIILVLSYSRGAIQVAHHAITNASISTSTQSSSTTRNPVEEEVVHRTVLAEDPSPEGVEVGVRLDSLLETVAAPHTVLARQIVVPHHTSVARYTAVRHTVVDHMTAVELRIHLDHSRLAEDTTAGAVDIAAHDIRRSEVDMRRSSAGQDSLRYGEDRWVDNLYLDRDIPLGLTGRHSAHTVQD